MRHEQRVNASPVNGFSFSLEAYVGLIQVRDQLRLLGDLAEPIGEGASDRIALSAEALANCFARLAEDVEQIVDATTPLAV